MPSRKQLAETLARSMPSRKQLTETPDRSTAPRTSAYGDARPLNGAEHRGCWVRLKAHPRRIPPSLPPFSGESWEGGLFASPGKELPNAPGEQTTPPPSPQAGCRGRSPRRGYRGSPPVPKNVGGWAGGTTAQAKPVPSLIEGARQDKTIRPHRRADAGVRGPCHTPLAIYERVCYSTPMKSATGPLLFLGACRIHEHWGLTTENPPVAGALREQPKGQDPPRKAGIEANTASRLALWSR